MYLDWLKSLRNLNAAKRRTTRGFPGVVATLEERKLLTALPVGSETLVNSTITSSQRNAVVASDWDGNYVVAWQSLGQDGSGYGIYAQRYNSAGVAQGSEFPVNTHTTGNQIGPAISLDADGDFVIAWSSAQDGSGYGIYAQRYDSSGVAQGSEFPVNTHTTNNQLFSSVALDKGGNFVITWRSLGQDGDDSGIYAQRYNSSGVAQGTEFKVNTYTTDNQSSPVVSLDGFGNFVIAWHSEDQDGGGYGIYAQRYNAAGVAQGTEFRVNSTTTNDQRYPAIGLDQDGDFVITWKSNLQDGSNAGIYAQRYNSSGVAQGTEFRVNSFTTNEQGFPKIGLDKDGDFVIAWESYGQDASQSGVYAKRFNAAGIAQGDEFRVNTYITSDQRLPSIGLDEDGSFVIAWESSGQDGSNFGIYSQRYKLNTAPVVAAGMFPRLPDWWRKSKTNPGDTVANVIDSLSPTDLITDVDSGSAEGFAVIDATNPNGTWEYSLNDGISWNSLADASTTNARLLHEAAMLRFVPFKKKFRGDVMMTVVGWDRTGGDIGGTADVTTRGGETSFSLETSQVTLTVLKKKPKF